MNPCYAPLPPHVTFEPLHEEVIPENILPHLLPQIIGKKKAPSFFLKRKKTNFLNGVNCNVSGVLQDQKLAG
jgi:hypothetical protein